MTFLLGFWNSMLLGTYEKIELSKRLLRKQGWGEVQSLRTDVAIQRI